MKLHRFAKYAWAVVAYNLLVIIWGAYVRASRSGDGCGSHWPLCNGEVIPLSPTGKTLIEFSHRLTSGLALISMIALLAWGYRHFARRDHGRVFVTLAMFFMIAEALIGAGLVLLEYVAENKSMARALWMSAHLINTFLLLAMLSLTAWEASIEERAPMRSQGALNWIFATALLGTLILGISGAVTALGGTLFPVTSLAEGLKQDLSPTAHVLIRLRFFHPFIAIGVSVMLFAVARAFRIWRPGVWTNKFSRALTALILIQLLAGAMNLLLHAPIWLQLIHLLLSNLIWISLVLLARTALAQPISGPALVITSSEPILFPRP